MWPAAFEGAPIYPVPLSAGEEQFNAGFPGSVARFSDGEREFILRWVTAGTRKLHSSADCFRGLGYSVSSGTTLLDPSGARWSCFAATRGPRRVQVRERITSEADACSWTDVSAWYWSTLLRQTQGPWMAITVIDAGEG